MKLTKPQALRWTREEYYRMAAAGLLGDRRVELIRGEIIEMSPQDSLHATGISLVDTALRRVFAQGFVVRVQLPLSLGRDSDPEPDLAVVRGSPRDYLRTHPRTAVLIVEVAESSLEYDRETKGALYAEAGITDYWIVNLTDRSLEVYRDPRINPRGPDEFRYMLVKTLGASEAVSPLAMPQAALPVEDLLP